MRILLVILAAAFLAVGTPPLSRAGEPAGGNGEGKAPPAEKKEADAELETATLASTLVIEGRAIGVKQCFREHRFTGTLHVLIRASRVLKGVLGPVNAVEVPVPARDASSHKDFLCGVTDPDGPTYVIFMDEIDRFRLPPAFRLVSAPRPSACAPKVTAIVKDELERRLGELRDDHASVRDTAFKKIIAVGTPALPSLLEIQREDETRTVEEARLAVNTIRRLSVDPCRIFQPNRQYPDEPVPAFATPDCKDILFRLPPATLVFRLLVWSDGNHVSFRIRTHDGREGWVHAKACAKEECEDW
jgi:hypothetical protein